jgi:tartrate dehydratase beta subunit/fumarate hydratase class I family protein
MKNIFMLFFTIYSLNSSCQSFDYLSCLRSYWNYRYHTVGDAINTSQHMPFDGNFLSPSGIGEPGMTVIGTDAGMSLLSDGIATNNQPYPANSDLTIYGGPYPNVSSISTTPSVWTAPTTWYRPTWVYCNPTDPNSEQAWKPVGSCTKCGGCTNQLNSGLGPSLILGKGGVVQFSTEAPHGMAMYIMTLATEWKLLYENGADRF